MYVLLVRNWSAAMCGQHRKGTPLVKPSVVEFHPQRLTKHETDKRANTISCGVHSAIFLPFQCLEFWNPFGNFAVYTSMKSGLIVLLGSCCFCWDCAFLMMIWDDPVRGVGRWLLRFRFFCLLLALSSGWFEDGGCGFVTQATSFDCHRCWFRVLIVIRFTMLGASVVLLCLKP
ncbi:hypothetical protein V6N11_050623 [Hibiscus sabdariffa]|uniref:Uncharacterized protein n=2 Tax=Hibiscus sabdariffa TaxID=183260 RepID=A0ABR2BXG2_9ROSI